MRITSGTPKSQARAFERTIGPWGTVWRLLIGIGAISLALLTRARWSDGVAGLVVLPAALTVILALRGRSARPLRMGGPEGPALMCTTVVGFGLLFVFLPQPGLLFFGSSVLLATARGQAGCEVLAFPNFFLRRDDQIDCCLFGPVDAADARRPDATSRRAPVDRVSRSPKASGVDEGPG